MKIVDIIYHRLYIIYYYILYYYILYYYILYYYILYYYILYYYILYYYILYYYILYYYILYYYILYYYILYYYILYYYTNWKENDKDEILYNFKRLLIGLPPLSLEPWKSPNFNFNTFLPAVLLKSCKIKPPPPTPAVQSGLCILVLEHIIFWSELLVRNIRNVLCFKTI